MYAAGVPAEVVEVAVGRRHACGTRIVARLSDVVSGAIAWMLAAAAAAADAHTLLWCAKVGAVTMGISKFGVGAARKATGGVAGRRWVYVMVFEDAWRQVRVMVLGVVVCLLCVRCDTGQRRRLCAKQLGGGQGFPVVGGAGIQGAWAFGRQDALASPAR